jgi:5-methylcytosine-specific restriction endonuclease McrBC regulatory subunit McrC
MLGYGYKYLNGEGELVLIYPKTSNFEQPLEHSFNYDDQNKLKLRVVPFDVSHICKERNLVRLKPASEFSSFTLSVVKFIPVE